MCSYHRTAFSALLRLYWVTLNAFRNKPYVLAKLRDHHSPRRTHPARLQNPETHSVRSFSTPSKWFFWLPNTTSHSHFKSTVRHMCYLTYPWHTAPIYRIWYWKIICCLYYIPYEYYKLYITTLQYNILQCIWYHLILNTVLHTLLETTLYDNIDIYIYTIPYITLYMPYKHTIQSTLYVLWFGTLCKCFYTYRYYLYNIHVLAIISCYLQITIPMYAWHVPIYSTYVIRTIYLYTSSLLSFCFMPHHPPTQTLRLTTGHTKLQGHDYYSYTCGQGTADSK